VEALQILLTLLIGLVLQLQAISTQCGAESDIEPGALDAILIVLNGVVIFCALIQQPIMRNIYNGVVAKISILREKCHDARTAKAAGEVEQDEGWKIRVSAAKSNNPLVLELEEKLKKKTRMSRRDSALAFAKIEQLKLENTVLKFPDETRLDTDGHRYTKAEFSESYGRLAEWDAAETRRGADGFEYSKVDFQKHFSVSAWDGAERRVNEEDGRTYSKTDFIEHFGGLDEWDSAGAIQDKTLRRVNKKKRLEKLKRTRGKEGLDKMEAMRAHAAAQRSLTKKTEPKKEESVPRTETHF